MSKGLMKWWRDHAKPDPAAARGILRATHDARHAAEAGAPWPRMFSADLDDERPVLVVSNQPDHLGDQIAWIREQGIPVLLGRSLAVATATRFRGKAPYSLILVDIDMLGDLPRVIDDLLTLRAAFRDVPVILVSRDLAQDDFSTQRLPICDVSLRWPASFYRLEMAIAEAQVNNRQWQARCGAAQGATAH